MDRLLNLGVCFEGVRMVIKACVKTIDVKLQFIEYMY